MSEKNKPAVPLDDKTLLSLLSATAGEVDAVRGPHLSSEQIVDRVSGMMSSEAAAEADVHLAFCKECHALAYWLDTGELSQSGGDRLVRLVADVVFTLNEIKHLTPPVGPLAVAAADAGGRAGRPSFERRKDDNGSILVSIDAAAKVVVSVEHDAEPVPDAEVTLERIAGADRTTFSRSGRTDGNGEVSLGALTDFPAPGSDEHYRVAVGFAGPARSARAPRKSHEHE